MLTFIIANTFLNIIAATQYSQRADDFFLGTREDEVFRDTNAAVSVIVLRKYFVCGVKWEAPQFNMSHFVIFETDTQTGAPNTFNLLKFYSV